MLTEKDYCDYDTCVALKELGYNRGAYAYYFPNHKEDLIFNTHPMRGCSINEMVRGYNTYSKDTVGHELIDAPTLYEAQKFLREEKDAHIAVKPTKGKYYCIILLKDKTPMLLTHENIVVRYFDSYEEALSESIKEVVKILKEK